MYVFEIPGGTAQCTGQLIADTDPNTVRRLFLTAAHCVSRKSEARSASFFWRFRRANCGGGAVSMIQTSGGARLRFTTGTSGDLGDGDTTVLELKRKPASETYLGWTVAGNHIGDMKGATIHHPSGDYMKGTTLKRIDNEALLEQGAVSSGPPFTHYEVVWRKGTTESGSSGSALMVGKRWPQQFAIGVLSGGFASRAGKNAPDYVGSMFYVWENFRKFRKLLDP